MGAEVDFIEGRRNVLIIAPHGFQGDSSAKANDERTGHLARSMSREFGFHALINEKYKKPLKTERPNALESTLNMNSISHITQYAREDFLNRILHCKNSVIKEYGSLLILLLHGIGQKSIETYITQHNENPGTGVLLGYGQAAPGDERLTIEEKCVETFTRSLRENRTHPILAAKTHPAYWNYRAWNEDNLNQFFRMGKYADNRVRSLQLEMRFEGLRDDRNSEKTAQTLGAAILSLSNQE
jgi:hypothetical protein